ncbi:MAG: DUF4384 domain-containing protein [Lentisphaeria bacterium]|nr:DUF4384 domain-containing protein [Lentisphaeria bacterium]
MLIIKQIRTREDFLLAEKADPQASSRIFLLNKTDGRSSFFPMTPLAKADTKTFFGLLPRLNATIWEGGYYVRDFSLDMKFEGSVENTLSPRKLLTSLALRINGIDMEKDVSPLTGMLRNGELYDEDLKKKLNGARADFFRSLSAGLYDEETPKKAIFDLAVDSFAKFFPPFRVEILFADMDEELTPAEKEYKEAMEQLNAKRRDMDLELKERQSRSDYAISLMEIEENEENIRNTVTLRQQERELNVRNNELQLRLLNETADDRVEIEMLKLAREKAEIALELKLVENKILSSAKEQESEKIKLEMLRDRQLEDAREAQRRDEIHRKQMEKVDAELLMFRMQTEEIKARIGYMKTLPVSDGAVSEAQTVPSITNEAIRQQENRIRILNDALLNTVAGVRNEALLDMLQEKSCTHPVALKKALSPVRISARDIALDEQFDDNAVRIGDRMYISFSTPVKGYLTLLCFTVTGKITLLSPNIIDGTVLLEPGVEYTMPGGDFLPRHALRQQGPAGRERIAAIVAPEALATVPEGTGGLADLEESHLATVISRLQELPAESWAAGYLGYTVMD